MIFQWSINQSNFHNNYILFFYIFYSLNKKTELNSISAFTWNNKDNHNTSKKKKKGLPTLGTLKRKGRQKQERPPKVTYKKQSSQN